MNTAIERNKRKQRRISSTVIDTLQLDILSLPAILALFIFSYLPMFGVIIAFKDFNANVGILKSEWVGFTNFELFFSSLDWWRILRNTVLYGVDFMLVGTVSSLFAAVLVYQVKRRAAIKYYQTSMILPNFLSMVLIAYITYAILNPVSGVANRFLGVLGIKGVDWYADPKYWPFILTVVNVWKSVGMSSIVYYAAMVGIDETLFEAARIDGANKWQETRFILIPEISSVICITLILGVGSLISGDFGLFYQIPMNIGVLYPTTDIINTYVFRGLQNANNMGATAAVGLMQSVISLILIIGSNLVVKRINPDNSLF